MKKIVNIRWIEIGTHGGTVLLGAFITIPGFNIPNLARFFLGFVAYLLISSHILFFNDWAQSTLDSLSNKKQSKKVLTVSLLSLFFAVVIYALLSYKLLILAIVSAMLWACYAHPKIFLKKKPFISFFIALTSGAIEFLGGYILFADFSPHALFFALFFGILMMAGQHYHEAGDYEVDKKAMIKTNAVRYGKKKIFIYGFLWYSIACIYFSMLYFTNIINKPFFIILWLTFPFYVYFYLNCVKQGITIDSVKQFVKHYRLIYIVIGIYIIAINFASFL